MFTLLLKRYFMQQLHKATTGVLAADTSSESEGESIDSHRLIQQIANDPRTLNMTLQVVIHLRP